MTTIPEQIEASLAKLRPAIQADGGNMEFISFNPATGVATLRLTGACSGCAMAAISIKEAVEPQLKAEVPGVTAVEALEE
jgi:Fe-S cluster biogenesis protein NfuA